jgi:methylmalonyl-CoA/ethylmalonyl-CoA epimerase
MDFLEFHHIGTVVKSIEDSLGHYSVLFGKENISDIIKIESQMVNVCFIRIAAGSYIELVEPSGEDSPVYQLFKKRISYYHIGYKVSLITEAVTKLETMNYKSMDYFHSEAFNGKRCIFLFSPEAHLIELIEK